MSQDIYASIAEELATGNIDQGLWTRLFAECDGDETNVKVQYIKQRAKQLTKAHDGPEIEPTLREAANGPDRPIAASPDTHPGSEVEGVPFKTAASQDETKRSANSFAAGPWSRLLARALDLSVCALVTAPLTYYIWRTISGSDSTMSSGAQHVVFLMLVAPCLFLADACIVGVFGSNLGKGLLRIRVLDVKGKPIGFGQALNRNALLYLYGYWGCIPLVSLIPHFIAYLNLSEKGITSWDSEGGFKVVRSSVGIARGLIYFVAMFAITLGIGLASKAQLNQVGADATYPVNAKSQTPSQIQSLPGQIAGESTNPAVPVEQTSNLEKHYKWNKPARLTGFLEVGSFENCCFEGKVIQEKYYFLRLQSPITLDKDPSFEPLMEHLQMVSVGIDDPLPPEISVGGLVTVQCKNIWFGATGHYPLPAACVFATFQSR